MTITALPTTLPTTSRSSGCARRCRAALRTTTTSITTRSRSRAGPQLEQLASAGERGRWDHNGFWNNNWNARNFNCPNCRWGWVGPVFWPFGWGDMFSFAWWPYAATAPFWNYNVDYIMGGLFWPNGAYAWPSGGYGATAWTQNDNSYTYARQSHQDIYSSGPADGSDDQQAARRRTTARTRISQRAAALRRASPACRSTRSSRASSRRACSSLR